MAALLLIDDDPDLRCSLAITLTGNGHTVITAEHGLAGLRALAETPIDIVITDIIMPEMEGLETIRELRNRWPNLKIIAMSGAWATSRSYLDMAERFGANYSLAKPFETQDLLDLIDRARAASSQSR